VFLFFFVVVSGFFKKRQSGKLIFESDSKKKLKKATACKPEEEQGCQMVSFQTKKTNLGIFWRTSERKVLLYTLEYFTTIGYTHWQLGNFVVIWYFLPSLVHSTKKNLATQKMSAGTRCQLTRKMVARKHLNSTSLSKW
jgi:hypothetical protein